MPPFAPTEIRAAEEWRRARPELRQVDRVLPEETPIGLGYDGEPHAVLMATPQDIEDLVVGFTISEGIALVTEIEDVCVTVAAESGGLAVSVKLTPQPGRRRSDWRRRAMEARSSCGLCGVEALQSAVRHLPSLPDGFAVARGAIQSSLKALGAEQALGAETRGTHAAALADQTGRLLLVREDVGRHNALDKLIGAALRGGFDTTRAFAVITSRCSYEMVEKTALAGIPILVAISAPTALALRKAEEAGMTVVALARDDGHAVFTRPDRVLDVATAEA